MVASVNFRKSFIKYIRILSHFVRNDGTYTACTDNKNFTHFVSY